jgi:DNA-binding NarL/FixJ family response regulator
MEGHPDFTVNQSPVFGDIVLSDAGQKSAIAIVDDQIFSRECLRQILVDYPIDGTPPTSFENYDEMRGLRNFEPQLIILNIHSAGSLAEVIQPDHQLDIPTLLISDLRGSELVPLYLEVARAGILGLVSSADTRPDTIRAALPFLLNGGTIFPRQLLLQSGPETSGPERPQYSVIGNRRFTPRQTQVLGLMRQGKPNKIIAYELGLSQATAKVHVRAVIRLMGATNRTEAVVRAGQIALLFLLNCACS